MSENNNEGFVFKRPEYFYKSGIAENNGYFIFYVLGYKYIKWGFGYLFLEISLDSHW